MAPAEEGCDLLLQPHLEHKLGGPGHELPQRMAGAAGLELGGQGFPHVGARWYPLHGVGAPFSVPSGRSGVATGRVPYAFPFLHRVWDITTDGYTIAIEVGPVLLALLVLGTAGWVNHYYYRRRRLPSWSVVEAEVQLGGIGTVKIRPSYEDIQVAHKARVELVTRKAALPFDEDHDVITEVYNSWYALFHEMRSLTKTIPAEKVRGSKDTQELVRLLVDALNKGLRPHLTQWQARFRHWYEEAIKQNPGKSPQEVQRDYPQYRELVGDLIKVNKQLVEYANVIKQIAQGKGQ